MTEKEIAKTVDIDLGMMGEFTYVRDGLILILLLMVMLMRVIHRVMEWHDGCFCGAGGMEMVGRQFVALLQGESKEREQERKVEGEWEGSRRSFERCFKRGRFVTT